MPQRRDQERWYSVLSCRSGNKKVLTLSSAAVQVTRKVYSILSCCSGNKKSFNSFLSCCSGNKKSFIYPQLLQVARKKFTPSSAAAQVTRRGYSLPGIKKDYWSCNKKKGATVSSAADQETLIVLLHPFADQVAISNEGFTPFSVSQETCFPIINCYLLKVT